MPLPIGHSSSDTSSHPTSGDHPSKIADQTASKLVEAGNSKGADTGASRATDAQAEADRKYEEAIEDEYAKREGGA